MEELFDTEALQRIILSAQQNADDYTGGLVVTSNITPETLVTISVSNGLIFVEGNEYTGFRHLANRHAPFSTKHYWLPKDDGGSRLDQPSKFHHRMMPVIDYVKVADSIFCEANKNITKNNRPDLFDKYTGHYSFQGEEAEKYHLLMYKDTRIVHSLFPDKKKHNEKNRTKLAKGTVSVTTKLPEGFNDMCLPYLGSNTLPVYSVLFRKYYHEAVERLFIVQHNEAGEYENFYLLAERKFTEFESFSHEDMSMLQYGDVSEFEDLINELDRQKKQP